MVYFIVDYCVYVVPVTFEILYFEIRDPLIFKNKEASFIASFVVSSVK